MSGELEKALSKSLGNESVDSELLQAMSSLLVLLLSRLDSSEEKDLAKELTDRIKNKYSQPSSLANNLIPSPS